MRVEQIRIGCSTRSAREARSDVRRTIIPSPAAIQCRTGKRRMAIGKEKIERSGRTG